MGPQFWSLPDANANPPDFAARQCNTAQEYRACESTVRLLRDPFLTDVPGQRQHAIAVPELVAKRSSSAAREMGEQHEQPYAQRAEQDGAAHHHHETADETAG